MANNNRNGGFSLIRSEFKGQDTINGTLFSINPWKKQSFDTTNKKYVDDDDKGKYFLTILVKKDSVSGRKVEALLNSLTKKVQAKKPNYKHIPIGGTAIAKNSVRDGDKPEFFETHREEYTGNYVISLKNGSKPITLLDRDGYKIQIGDEESLTNDFYNGVTVGVNGWFYHHDSPLGVYGTIRSAIFRMDGKKISFEEEISASDFGEMSQEEMALFMADFESYD